MNNTELTKFEFLLTLDNNIVIQRFFNVKDFNPKSINSTDLYYCVKDICDEISDDLKIKTIDYMLENINYYYDVENLENEIDSSKETFLLEIKLENKVFMSRIFSANVFHPKVRYTVDIRPKVRNILMNLTSEIGRAHV